MKVSELYYQTAGLGFEASLESDPRFIYAANRALLQVNALRPATKLYRLLHAPLKNICNEDSTNPIMKANEELIFTAKGAKAYYFECTGSFFVTFEYLKEDGTWESTNVHKPSLLIDRNFFSPNRGLCKDVHGKDLPPETEVRLRFWGNYSYMVQNVAFYDSLYSDKSSDIPAFSEYCEYDLSILADDKFGISSGFLRLAPVAVIDEDEREIISKDVYTENGRLVYIARNKPGTYLVRYYTKPKVIKEAKIEEAIDLDEDLCALLPTLIASYLFAEDEPNLAEYYQAAYYKMAAELEARSRTIGTANITNNGW